MANEFIKTSRVSPAFLHGNSTSHTWPFSAVAEIIDNAYDPDVSASEIWIDKRVVGATECLTFVDNGNGMSQEKLHKMLSFGYCEKVQVGKVSPIGYYGNGFKSGSMRLGTDALVFTRCMGSTSVGFLSQTYLKAIGADSVLVPIVTWNISGANQLIRKRSPESDTNLKAILSYSVFKTEKEILYELRALEKMRTGTNIIIFNLKKDRSGNLELDFSSDKNDIRNPETPLIDLTTINRPVYNESPEYRRSLRDYCSILYLKPRMKIVLRGNKVHTKLISKCLSQTERDVYKPTWLDKPIKLIFGFTNNKEPDSYGLMMYHKNRLIRAYEKVGCQKQANTHGVGVLGVVEVNFLEPIHNKQEFNRTDKYLAFMQNAGGKLNDYFFEKTNSQNPSASQPASSQLPDWTWAQCDNCLSWRRLPAGISADSLPDKWFCKDNPDATFNRCDIQEEPEDDDAALIPTYTKTYKKTIREKEKQAKQEEARKLKQKEEALAKKEALLKKKADEISRQQEELEVSSSQDPKEHKPTVADLEKARKKMQACQEKISLQEKTILQLEKQKQAIEEKSTAMLRMARSLEITNSQSKTLVEKVQNLAGQSSSAVSSSSTSKPVKRKSDDEDGSNERCTKIKTEDGGFITVPNAGGDAGLIDLTMEEENLEETGATTKTPGKTKLSAPHPKNGNKSVNKEMGTAGDADTEDSSNKLVESDKTLKKTSETKTDKNFDKENKKDSANETEGTPVEADGDGYMEMNDDDVKPDKEKLDKTVCKDEENVSKAKEEVDMKERNVEVMVKKGEVKKEFKSAHVQTVPVISKLASPEEVDLLSLSAVEQKQMLLVKARELSETKKSLTSLQSNIWKLLKIIVSDFDYGDPENIEQVIVDFIRVNGEEGASEESDEKPDINKDGNRKESTSAAE
ncbi:MORC family CW-type zinc finger protein 3-like [Mya arenaria]|uniref:MORC family CW-type zinc finger protein 3-like n=1 Tax=Mya arenaria TaxID=6604 RepID=UPI0022E81B30|nr:MORC family CW-type zinc finger protein 3-like [Mya arenaria]